MTDASPAADDLLARLHAPPVFVVGVARSGTTWVYDILTAHPEVAGVYESFLFTTHDGFGSLFGEVQWRDRGGQKFGLSQMVSREELVAQVRTMASEWMARVLEPQHRFLVEKSPSHFEVADLIDEVFPEARFVHVQRDGRDVVVSARAAAKSWAKEWRRGRVPVTLPPYFAAKSWARHVAASAELARRFGPDRYYSVRYEDLKARPVEEIGKLYDFCGIPYDDARLQEVYEATDFDRQFTGGESEFRRGGRVGDWRSRFSLVDRAAFAAGAGDALVHAGYERSRRWWLSRPSD